MDTGVGRRFSVTATIALTLSLLVMSTSAACDSSPGGALGLVPDDVSYIAVVDVESILAGDFPPDAEDSLEDAWEDLEELGIYLDDIATIVLSSGDKGSFVVVEGDFNSDDIRDGMDDGEYEDDEYRGYELWTGGYGMEEWVVLLEDDGYLLMGREDVIRDMLRTLDRGTGFLFDEDDTDLVLAYMRAGDGWIVSAEESCDLPRDVRGCEAMGAAVSRAEEPWMVNLTIAVLFRNERTAESEMRDVEDYLADDLDVEDVAVDGRFVVISAIMDEEEWDLTAELWR